MFGKLRNPRQRLFFIIGTLISVAIATELYYNSVWIHTWHFYNELHFDNFFIYYVYEIDTELLFISYIVIFILFLTMSW